LYIHILKLLLNVVVCSTFVDLREWNSRLHKLLFISGICDGFMDGISYASSHQKLEVTAIVFPAERTPLAYECLPCFAGLVIFRFGKLDSFLKLFECMTLG
jgi:hypothetical protein|tara:strand:- start:455 stop:757 length:303 start_codon:yes stop_codon:yes gene_type:complete